MADYNEVFVGIDTSKLRNAVAIAEGGRNSEVRYLGEIENTGATVSKLVKKLAAQHQRLTFCMRPGLHRCTIITTVTPSENRREPESHAQNT